MLGQNSCALGHNLTNFEKYLPLYDKIKILTLIAPVEKSFCWFLVAVTPLFLYALQNYGDCCPDLLLIRNRLWVLRWKSLFLSWHKWNCLFVFAKQGLEPLELLILMSVWRILIHLFKNKIVIKREMKTPLPTRIFSGFWFCAYLLNYWQSTFNWICIPKS